MDHVSFPGVMGLEIWIFYQKKIWCSRVEMSLLKEEVLPKDKNNFFIKYSKD